MPTQLKITLDISKMRIYLTGDTANIHQYLRDKEYADVSEVMAAKQATINQARIELKTLREQAHVQSDALRSLSLVDDEAAFRAIVGDVAANGAAQEEVEKVEVVGSKVAHGGKKWAGVYYQP